MGVVAAYGMYRECCDGELEPHWANKSGLKVSTGPHLEPLMTRRPILTSTACHSSSEMASSFDSVDCRIRRSCFFTKLQLRTFRIVADGGRVRELLSVEVDGRKEGAEGGGEVGRAGRYRLVRGGAIWPCPEEDANNGRVWCVCSYFVAAGRSR